MSYIVYIPDSVVLTFNDHNNPNIKRTTCFEQSMWFFNKKGSNAKYSPHDMIRDLCEEPEKNTVFKQHNKLSRNLLIQEFEVIDG